MARRGFNQKLVTARVDSREVLRAMGKLPKDVQNEIRDTNKRNADLLAAEVRRNIGVGDPPQARLIEPSIRGVRDRNIKVEAGGPRGVGRPYKSRTKQGRKYRAPAGALVYGAEYGSSGKSQDRKGRTMGERFVKGRNKQGYFLTPALGDFAPKLLQIWYHTINREIQKRGLK